MRGLAGVLVAALLGGCSALVPPPTPTCDAATFGQEPALSCEAGVAAVLDSLPPDGTVTEVEFMYGSLCPPNARCMTPDGSAGTVIVTYGDGTQVSVYVRLENAQIVTEASTPYPPPWLEEG